MTPIVLGIIGVVAILLLVTQSANAEDFTVADKNCCGKWSLSDGATTIAFAMAGFETGTRSSFDPHDNSAWQGKAKPNNNPGNLQDVNGNERQYQTPAAGFEAMIRDIEMKIQGKTTTGIDSNSSIRDLVSVWTSTVGDRQNYASFVAGQVGVDADAPFNSYIEVA